MRTFWTMNFERLNGKIKAPSHIINNFRNPQLLVFRRQCATFNKTLCLKDSVCVNSTIESYISDFLNVDMISSFFDSSAEEIVSLTDSIKINGVNYIVGLFVIVEKSDQGFNFGKIEKIVFKNIDDPVLLVCLYNTETFDNHSFSFVIKPSHPSLQCLYRVNDLLDFHPLDGIEKTGRLFVRMKYFVF